jgi:hypothetical protein
MNKWLNKDVSLVVDEQEVSGRIFRIADGLLFLLDKNGKKLVVAIEKVSDIKEAE